MTKVLILALAGNTFLIQYWNWALLHFCVWELVFVILKQFDSIDNNPKCVFLTGRSIIASPQLLLASNNKLYGAAANSIASPFSIGFTSYVSGVSIQAVDSISSQSKIFFASSTNIMYVTNNDPTVYNAYVGIGVIQSEQTFFQSYSYCTRASSQYM